VLPTPKGPAGDASGKCRFLLESVTMSASFKTLGERIDQLHYSLEVVLGTLVGAALGGNLYLLVAGRRN
jgi:hypothetical protein